MKKIFYGLFFFILTFSSINVVMADDRYCTYEIEGTNATIVARIGNNDVYVDYSNAKGKGGEYEYNLTNYNVFDYVKKNNKCPKYAYRFKTPIYQGDKKLDIKSHYNYKFIFTDTSNLKSVSLKNIGNDVMTIENTFVLSSNASGKSLSCSLVDPKTGSAKFKYNYNSGSETYTLSGKTINPTVDGTSPYKKNKCPQFVIYDSSSNKLNIYYEGDNKNNLGMNITNAVGKGNLYVLNNTPMLYCSYAFATVGYIGNLPYAYSGVGTDVQSLLTISGMQNEKGEPTCFTHVYAQEKKRNSGILGGGQTEVVAVTPTFIDGKSTSNSKLLSSFVYPKSTENISDDYKNKLSCEYTRKGIGSDPTSLKINLSTNGNISANGNYGNTYTVTDSEISNKMKAGSCPENVWLAKCGSGKCVSLDKSGTKYKYVQEGLTSEDYKATGDIYTGVRFKELMNILYPYLIEVDADKLQTGPTSGKYTYGMVYFSGTQKAIKDWGMTGKYSCTKSDCMDTFDYEFTQKVKDVAVYCNDLYNRYNTSIAKMATTDLNNRLEECISYDYFYQWLVDNGKVNRFDGNCSLISQDVYNMLQTALNIIKVAGPILAIALGMIDFAKVIVSGDADKELKQAGQRFLKRIIAAAVLLLLPIILSFLMNIFLKGETGYDSDNPFCNLENMRNLEK